MKKVYALAGCEIKRMRPIFKTEMFIYQSNINFDGEILFRKIAHHLDPEIKKMLVKGIIRTRIPHCTLVHDFFAIEIKILFLNLTM